MIYSPSFTHLQPHLRRQILTALRAELESPTSPGTATESRYPHLSLFERQEIAQILRETVSGYGSE
jgi:hypothetical protein